jgi:hypothetical protein
VVLALWVMLGVVLWLPRLFGAYNRIVATSEQVEAGARLIDIALAKRAALIPQLAAVAKAAANHESGAIQAMAEQRWTGTALQFAELYPAFSSNQELSFLHQQFVAVEDDLAMAEGFHEEAIAIAKTRQGLFPDRYFVPKRLTDAQKNRTGS